MIINRKLNKALDALSPVGDAFLYTFLACVCAVAAIVLGILAHELFPLALVLTALSLIGAYRAAKKADLLSDIVDIYRDYRKGR